MRWHAALSANPSPSVNTNSGTLLVFYTGLAVHNPISRRRRSGAGGEPVNQETQS
jgi:hypothetical protein